MGDDGRPLRELVEDHAGGACRAVYTVRFETAVYVLHAFQKKSKRGIETPQPEKDMIVRRLKEAEIISRSRSATGGGGR